MDTCDLSNEETDIFDECPPKRLRRYLNSARKLNWDELMEAGERSIGERPVEDIRPEVEVTKSQCLEIADENGRYQPEAEEYLSINTGKTGTGNPFWTMSTSRATVKTFINESCDVLGKYSQCRGETPVTNETNKPHSEERQDNTDIDTNMDLLDGVEGKKTPDRSLFKKLQEQLLHECNLTPKKPKKKVQVW